MFMKKYFRYALMAVLTVGLSLAATSCKDDDNDNGNHCADSLIAGCFPHE